MADVMNTHLLDSLRSSQPKPVLYGEGGTHNHLLGEGHKGTIVYDMETGAGERELEDMESEFTPLTPTSAAARRKKPRSFGE